MRVKEFEDLCIKYTCDLEFGKYNEADYIRIKKEAEEITDKFLRNNWCSSNEFVAVVNSAIIATSKTLDYFSNGKNPEKYTDVLVDMAILFKPLN